jgi:hypothetical protein
MEMDVFFSRMLSPCADTLSGGTTYEVEFVLWRFRLT